MNARGSAASVGSRGYTARMAGARAAMRPARIASGSPTASQASPARQRPSPSPKSRGVSPARRQAASTGITARSSAEATKWSGGASGAPVSANQARGGADGDVLAAQDVTSAGSACVGRATDAVRHVGGVHVAAQHIAVLEADAETAAEVKVDHPGQGVGVVTGARAVDPRGVHDHRVSAGEGVRL